MNTTNNNNNINYIMNFEQINELIYNQFNNMIKIGRGGYSKVYKIKNNQNNKLYALKVCNKIFFNINTARSFLREILLGRLLNNKYILKIDKVIMPKDKLNFTTICYTTELMDFDLRYLCNNNNSFNKIQIQTIMYQLLSGINYLHKSGVIHRDLKPENVFMNRDYSLKIGDFGLSRLCDNVTTLCQYTSSKYYMAPEILLESSYSQSVDMWCVGCILGELLSGNILFKCSNFTCQLDLIFRLIGSPDNFSWIDNKSNQKLLLSYGDMENNIKKIFKDCDKDGIDLLNHLLTWDPEDRFSAEQALNHNFLNKFDYDDENDGNEDIKQIKFEYDEESLNMNEIRVEIIKEIQMNYH